MNFEESASQTIFPLNSFSNIFYNRSKLLRMVKKQEDKDPNLISRCNVQRVKYNFLPHVWNLLTNEPTPKELITLVHTGK